jgi:hypothetical protein
MVHDGWFWGCLVGWFGFVLIVLRVLFARTPIPGTVHPYRETPPYREPNPTPGADVTIHVGRHKGIVYIQFSEGLSVARLVPGLARQTAVQLLGCADMAEGIVTQSEVRGILQEPPRRTAWQHIDKDE